MGLVRVGILLGICLVIAALRVPASLHLPTLHSLVAMPTQIVTINTAKRIIIHSLNFSGVMLYLLYNISRLMSTDSTESVNEPTEILSTPVAA